MRVMPPIPMDGRWTKSEYDDIDKLMTGKRTKLSCYRLRLSFPKPLPIHYYYQKKHDQSITLPCRTANDLIVSS